MRISVPRTRWLRGYQDGLGGEENLRAVLEQIRDTGRPVVVTVNGKPDAVLIDVATYERKLKSLNLAGLLAMGEEDIRVEITRSAGRAYEYKERLSPERAAKWFAEIGRQAQTLRQHPTRCPVIPDVDDIGIEYRHLIWGNYRTVFRIEGGTVYIVRVIHGAQVLETDALETSELPDRDD